MEKCVIKLIIYDMSSGPENGSRSWNPVWIYVCVEPDMTEVIILHGFEKDLDEGIDCIYYCKQEVVLKAGSHSHTVKPLLDWKIAYHLSVPCSSPVQDKLDNFHSLKLNCFCQTKVLSISFRDETYSLFSNNLQNLHVYIIYRNTLHLYCVYIYYNTCVFLLLPCLVVWHNTS